MPPDHKRCRTDCGCLSSSTLSAGKAVSQWKNAMSQSKRSGFRGEVGRSRSRARVRSECIVLDSLSASVYRPTLLLSQSSIHADHFTRESV